MVQEEEKEVEKERGQLEVEIYNIISLYKLETMEEPPKTGV